MSTPTPYSSVYSKFLEKISDYQIANLIQTDAEDLMHGYMISAIAKFTKSRVDLTNRDDTQAQFNITLSDLEIEIIAILMVIEWLSPKINNILLLKQVLNSKDFQLYSQAQHLRELQNLKNSTQSDIDKIIVDYTYSTEDFSKLG